MTDTDQIFRKAFADHRNGKLKDAAEGYQKVLTNSPNHPSALHLLGLIRFDEGNIDEALTLVAHSIELVTDDMQWQLNYGKILLKAGKHQSAVEAYLKALVIEPANVEAKVVLGDLYASFGKYNEALLMYYKILCDDCRNNEIAMKYADTIRAIGKSEEAESFLSWYPQINPDKGIPVETAFLRETAAPDRQSPNVL